MNVRLAIGLFILTALPVSAADPKTVVVALTNGREPFGNTALLQIRRLGSTALLPPFTVPSKNGDLRRGDMILSEGRLYMRVQCGEATLNFAGPFRVVIVHPGKMDCAVNLLAGGVNVHSTKPTRVDAGGVDATSRSTQYAVTVNAVGNDWPVRRVTLFEGALDVQPIEGEKVSVPEGGTLVANDRETQSVTTSAKDFDFAASVAATLDVSEAMQSEGNIDNPGVQRERLRVLHLEVLHHPHDRAAGEALASEQMKLGLEREASYFARSSDHGLAAAAGNLLERVLDAGAKELERQQRLKSIFANGGSTELCDAAKELSLDRDYAKARDFAKKGLERDHVDHQLAPGAVDECVAIVQRQPEQQQPQPNPKKH